MDDPEMRMLRRASPLERGACKAMYGVPNQRGHWSMAGAVGPGPRCLTSQDLSPALCDSSAHLPGCQGSEGDSSFSRAEPVAGSVSVKQGRPDRHTVGPIAG